MAIALVNVSTSFQSAGPSPISTSHAINGGGSDRIAIAFFAWAAAAGMTASAVTLGGSSMTSCGAASTEATNNTYAQAFYLANPPMGVQTLSFSVSGTIENVYGAVVTLSGVDLSNPIANYTTNTASSDITITPVDNGWICFGRNGGGVSSTTVTAPPVADATNVTGAKSFVCGHGTTSSTPLANVTVVFTPSTSNLATIGFALNPARPAVIRTGPGQGAADVRRRGAWLRTRGKSQNG
jgi:hypothetical protein